MAVSSPRYSIDAPALLAWDGEVAAALRGLPEVRAVAEYAEMPSPQLRSPDGHQTMDYELFLLFRIQREYLERGDNDRATVAGLSAVAPVITGADLLALKMIRVGLCGAVLVDATLIRGFGVPAVMSIAGRWNRFPGRRQTAGERKNSGGGRRQ